jgi:hypothetical protein
LRNSNLKIIIISYILIAVFLFIATFWISTISAGKNQLSPRFFPQVILSCIIFLNIIWLYQVIKDPEANVVFKKVSKEKKIRLTKTIIISLVFGILFNWLGAIPAILLCVLGFFWAWDIRKPVILILFPVGISLGVYLIFYKLLSVRLPMGIFKGLF